MCRRNKSQTEFRRSFLALVFGLLLAVVLPVSVFAVDPAAPDIFTIDDVQVVKNVAASGDVLVAFKYTIHYDSGQPTTPANKLFHFRLFAADSLTQLGAVEPYAYNNSGYDMGYSAFYFEPGSTPTWESALVLKMVGNPQYWVSPPVTNYTLVSTDYSQLESKSENQKLLGNWIIDVCEELEVDWSVKLLTETAQSTILNDTGSAYGKGTIPGLQYVAPKIFAVQSSSVDTSRRDWNTDEADSWGAQWSGTMVGDALNGLQEVFGGISWMVLTSLLTGVIIVVLFVWGFVSHQDNGGAMVAGGHVLTGSTALGFFHPALMAVVVLLYALFTGWFIWGDKS
ncbi:hypothetical protein [Dehalogenimonas alkenigignens]|uniref:hypothetical protein n=1 Tax=Dehalogenimonas alkenigignens TaxID=1217799 RepID=UPI000D58903B|nr:hypothetical protein [Dehalogenimonas alkenigignens]PVV83519.1 hypothetical protein DD509_06730 [Dehalogenimonas alkenigignens]